MIMKPHVVAVPYPAQGHSIPFLELAKHLASHALTVSFVTTPVNATRLQEPVRQAVSAGLDIRLLVLPTPAVEGLPEGCENTDLLPANSTGLIRQLVQRLAEPFNAWIDTQFERENEGGTATVQPPVCIIYDIAMGWTVETVKRHKIDTFWFGTWGASAMTILHSWACSVSQNALQKDDDGVVLSFNLPRPLRLQRHEIAADIFDPDLTNTRMQFNLRLLQSIKDSPGMLVNTFEGLEPEYLEHLRKLTGKPVWSVGPVLPPKISALGPRGKMADIGEQELVAWLDLRTRRSVLYVSFGSQACLTEEQSKALARALEATGQSFVWAFKVPSGIEPPTSSDSIMSPAALARMYLPTGFQERTKDRGLVIWGWSPQLVVLSHTSVGAFMTHCGWNSTLEGISLGVPLIAWPMSGDQHFNSRLVGELGVGIQVCQHGHGIREEETGKSSIQNHLKDCVGQLKSLEYMSIRECKGLRSLSSDFGCLTSLKAINASYCSQLEEKAMDSLAEMKTLMFANIRESHELIKRWEQVLKHQYSLAVASWEGFIAMGDIRNRTFFYRESRLVGVDDDGKLEECSFPEGGVKVALLLSMCNLISPANGRNLETLKKKCVGLASSAMIIYVDMVQEGLWEERERRVRHTLPHLPRGTRAWIGADNRTTQLFAFSIYRGCYWFEKVVHSFIALESTCSVDEEKEGSRGLEDLEGVFPNKRDNEEATGGYELGGTGDFPTLFATLQKANDFVHSRSFYS